MLKTTGKKKGVNASNPPRLSREEGGGTFENGPANLQRPLKPKPAEKPTRLNT